jgi:hypothetical protein
MENSNHEYPRNVINGSVLRLAVPNLESERRNRVVWWSTNCIMFQKLGIAVSLMEGFTVPSAIRDCKAPREPPLCNLLYLED